MKGNKKLKDKFFNSKEPWLKELVAQNEFYVRFYENTT